MMNDSTNYPNSNEITQKLKQLFPESIVNKKLVQSKQVSRLPRYISEYILMKMVGDNPSPENFEKMESFIARYHPEKRDKNLVKSRVMEFGSTRVLDRIKVSADPARDRYWGEIPVIDESMVPIDRNLVLENETLLKKGTWGFITIENRGMGKDSLTISSFEPFQIISYDMEYFCDCRIKFTTEEWIDVLINTLGLNPEVMKEEEKFMHLIRLIPLVENNVNFIELGPKGTGKTYLYRNTSNYSRVISGGKITPAALFFNLNTRNVGLLGLFDTVVFDEVSSAKLRDSEDTINKLKDYMESGIVSRGRKEQPSHASLVFVGNIPISEEGKPVSKVQFEILPKDMKDTAFLDRFTGYVEGWKFSRIKTAKTHLSNDYGFALDYFSEIIHDLRKYDYSSLIYDKLELKNFDIRDEKAFKKNLSGLLKILFPHKIIDNDYVKQVIHYATRLRLGIVKQKAFLDQEFKEKELSVNIMKSKK